jgi:hypothetical protein
MESTRKPRELSRKIDGEEWTEIIKVGYIDNEDGDNKSGLYR